MKRIPKPDYRPYQTESVIWHIIDGSSTMLTKEYPGYAIGFKTDGSRGIFRKAIPVFDKKSQDWRVEGGLCPSIKEIERFKKDIHQLATSAQDIRKLIEECDELK